MNTLLNVNVSFKEIRERAVREIISLMPQNYGAEEHEITQHLVNLTPTDLSIDADGGRVMGKFLPMDLTIGSPSPIVWSFAMDALVWGCVSIFLLIVAAVFGVWTSITIVGHADNGGINSIATRLVLMLPTLLGLIVMGQIAKVRAQSLVMTAALFVLFVLGLTIWDATGPMVVKIAWLSAMVNALPAAALAMTMFSAYCVVADSDPSASTATALSIMAGAVLLAVVFVPVVGPIIGVLVAGVSIFAPPLIVKGYEMARRRALAEAAHELAELGQQRDHKATENKRKQQILGTLEKFNREGDVILQLGVAKGVARALGEALSPDEGDILAIPYRALDTHMRVFGKPGVGKTTAMKRLIEQLVRMERVDGKPVLRLKSGRAPREGRQAGMLIADGKGGDLPRKMYKAGLLDYIIDPNDPQCPRVNLGAILPPGKIGGTFQAVFGEKGSEGQIWDKSAGSYVDLSSTLVHYVMKLSGGEVTFNRIRDACLIQAYREKLIEVCKARYYPMPADLAYAISGWEEFLKLHPGTMQSVIFTLRAWFDTISSNPKLNRLVGGEGEVDITTDLLTGGLVGVALSETDGQGGTLALNLIMTATFERLLAERSGRDNWADDGVSREFIFICDEAHTMLHESIVKFAAIGRSLGIKLVLIFQNIHQVHDALGELPAKALLDCIQTVITFGSSTTDGKSEKGVSTYEHVSSLTGIRTRIMRDGVDITTTGSLSDGVSAQRGDGRANRSEGSALDLAGSIASTVAEMSRAFSFGAGDQQSDSFDAMTRRRKARGKLQFCASITAEELAQNLDAQHQGFALIVTCGVPRMDFFDASPGIIDAPESVAMRDPLVRMARMPWLSPVNKATTKKEREAAMRIAHDIRPRIELKRAA